MTVVQWLPPAPVTAAFAVGLAMPLLLAGFARVPGGRLSLSHRFWLAMGTALAAWLIATGLHATWHTNGMGVEFLLDAGAGAMVLVTAGLVVYSIWSLTCFGFTVSMLGCLAETDGPLSLDAWAAAYGNRGGTEGLTRDRIAVLTAMGLAFEDQGHVRLASPLAVRLAWAVRLVSVIFAIKVAE